MISTVAGLLVAGLVFSAVSIFYRYWFLGPDPLARNTFARIEAAQKPEVLRDLYRDYRRRVVFGWVLGLVIAYGVITFISPSAANLILDAIWFTLKVLYAFVTQVGEALLELVRSLL